MKQTFPAAPGFAVVLDVEGYDVLAVVAWEIDGKEVTAITYNTDEQGNRRFKNTRLSTPSGFVQENLDVANAEFNEAWPEADE